jgi:Tfp pilus assembly pilus retraction ATPase PilT
LKCALTKFEEAKNKDIILAIGNTGSGKSTMLTALIYGTDYLSLEKKTYTI